MKIERYWFRWACAVVASLVSGFYGAHVYAWADEACGLKEVTAYQARLHSQTIEVTPRYKLKIAEGFVAECPLRFEVREAYLIAARAALDSGQGAKSARHYQAAIDTGADLSLAQRLDYAAALMSTGKLSRAAAIRDSAILHWAMQLTEDESAHLERVDVEGGAIYSARFDAVDPRLKISALWIAAPSNGGWPATAVIKPDAERGAWRALREGAPAPQILQVAEIYRCRERHLLDDSHKSLSVDGIERQAMDALKAYLIAPDVLVRTRPGKPIAACIYPNRMLYRPRPETATQLD